MEDMDPHIEITIPIDRKAYLIKESELFTKYAGFSQDESFIAILDSVDPNNDQNFKLLMYKVITNEVTKTKEISEEHSQPIIIADEEQEENEVSEKQELQGNLIRSSKFASWSIAVSHEHQEQFRLVAISCISVDDMIHLPYEDIERLCGFTKIWKVDNNFNIEKCEIEIEYGGVIQFLPNTDDKATDKAIDKAGNETSDEANDDKANDKFTLILVKGLGIYKHSFSYSSDSKQFQHDTLMLDYPERIIDALKYNYSEYVSKYLTVPRSDTMRKYFLRCLNGPYLLVDTSGRDPNKNIELYDLRTNQLLNVFKRYKFVLSILDREKPGAFAVSSDEKLLVFVAGNDLKIYLIENGLELSSLSCKDSGMHSVDFMKFIFNDEKLLIFKNDRTVAVWDIFNSVREFINFIPLEKDTTSGLVKPMTRIVIDPISENKPFTILSIRPFFDENQIVWDAFDLKEHLERSVLDQNWIKLDPSKHIITDSAPNAYGIGENNEIDKVLLTDLIEANPKYYLGIEPWTVHPAEKISDTYIKQRLQFPRYIIYLDTKQKTRLLIGYNTIQVWHEKRLEFIHVVNDDPETPEEPHEKFKVIEIRYEHEDSVIQIVRDAIKTLVYLDSQSKSVNLAVGGKRITFNEIVRQTKNIITRFIVLYSNPWRLIDFHYKLMLEFIKLKDYPLITRILFNEKNVSRDDFEKCISQILSVVSEDKENNNKTKLKENIINIISKHSSKNLKNKEKMRPLHSWLVPLKDIEGILLDEEYNTDPTMLTLFLEYYSNNAMDNIGWLNVVSEVIPELYDRNYWWYVQEFYYKPCFGRKRLDMSSMMFHEIKKHSENSLKVYMPITQLIPHNKDRNFKLEYIK
ncbi:myb-like transcription factor [Gigaspora margarita]|uniref:Myb-like transcription factor n=1 Tax=Gigaspora margarita TaxID=4874 RepID=A0A8H4AR00_GIGMA|nr:myb-like transcription factor [Gigaspora margarita]